MKSREISPAQLTSNSNLGLFHCKRMPKAIAICLFLFLGAQMMDAASVQDQDHCKGLFLLNDPTSTFHSSDPWLVGLSGFQAGWHCWGSTNLVGPCQCLVHCFTVRWRIRLKLDDQISNQRVQEESCPFILPFHTTATWHSPNRSHRYEIFLSFVDRSPWDD